MIGEEEKEEGGGGGLDGQMNNYREQSERGWIERETVNERWGIEGRSRPSNRDVV